jgi:protein-tyrosine-phosphatase
MPMRRIYASLRRRWRAARAVSGAREATNARLAQEAMRRVLVVCYGNIYRSAFIAEYLRQKLGQRVDVRGGGFHRKVGRPSPPEHVRMCAERGVDLAGHRSRCIEPADLEWADTIVLMDRHNWLALDELGAAPAKLVWAGVLAGGSAEIVDPYGRGEGDARHIVDRLERAASELARRIERS